ncbi:Phosphomevalonate kinase [Sandaracinus amylolyticus]|uniref:Phosphomevalonate kinase n=2 Tax=Sandaracinus amylolyticus TaxID=927083 RepID=A0A0F6VZK3_9BACT|nr:Phosphomevalonate kinase [Sandaracinus amylolyticus]
MDLAIDTTALREGSRKLGLGSSAAAAAGTVAAVAAANGLDVSDPSVRARLLPIALDGHRAVAPEGSGADVAASTLGGFVRVRREGEHLDAARIDWPASLHLALVWTGTPARTSDLVAKVKSLASRDATAYQRAITPLREAAATLLAAIERGDARSAIDAAAAHHDAMQLLGETAGAPIVTPELTKAATIARSIGGSAKPSGAGGGDVAIAFLPSESAIAELGDACRIAGLTLLPLRLGDDGVHVDEPLSS